MKEPKRSSALVRRETFASYCFLLPSLIFFLGFVIYPMILCVVTSFFDSTMNRADIFVGMANYKTLFADPIFLGALKNTFVIVIVSVPITCIFSLWVSSAIVDLPEWATSLFRCVFYLPMVKPGIGALAIFTFINSWNDYFMQLIMLSSTSNLTISLGIAKLQAENSTDFGLIMAGAALAAVPIIIIFLIFQKYFTKGIAMGAVKG